MKPIPSVLCALALLTARPAAAQCDGRWIYGPDQAAPASWGLSYYQSSSEPFRPVYATLAWDRDGDGPLAHELIAGGAFTEDAYQAPLSYIARWQAGRWVSLADGLSGPVHALTAWNAHEEFSASTELIAGGAFSGSVARWNGVRWRELPGGGFSSTTRVMTTWDPDGDGPLPADLIVAGSIGSSGGAVFNNIARNDGLQWHPLGSGVSGEVRALTAWDPDGPGPAPALLIAAGQISAAGGQPVSNIAAWNGSAWMPLGQGIGSVVYAVASWDVDDDGPQLPRLIATGPFNTAGGQPANYIAAWNGSAWSPLGTGLSSSTLPLVGGRALTTLDRDGPGPAPRELVVAGRFSAAGGVSAVNVAAWNGSQWRDVDAYLGGQRTPSTFTEANAITSWDPDGPGPGGDLLLAGGSFLFAGGSGAMSSRHVAFGDGFLWQPMTTGTDGAVLSLANWDPDGAGPRPAHMLMGGKFDIAGQRRTRHVTAWDGDDWLAFGAGATSGDVGRVFTLDPDGAGPFPADPLIAQTASPYLSRWTGSQWISIGDPVWTRAVRSMTSWDPDGDGPLPPSTIFAQGSSVQAWDGAQWTQIGGFNGDVFAVAGWDPDGAGPALPLLIAGGRFSGAIAAWNGAQWSLLGPGPGLDWTVRALAVFDLDGEGPNPPRLIAGGDFTYGGIHLLYRVGYFDGAEWQPMDWGFNASVHAITAWDPDGPGPGPAELLAGGEFTIDGTGGLLGGGPLRHIARWDGARWQPMGDGADGPVFAITPYERNGPGASPVELIVGGDFFLAGSQLSFNWARWSPAGRPWIASDPDPITVIAGETARFTIGPASGYDFDGPITYQWRRDGEPITDGPGGASAGGGTVSGASGSLAGPARLTLDIHGAQLSDAGDFDCLITNSCGSATSLGAALIISAPPCRPDLNHDGLVDFADYLEFLNRYEALDLTVDFNDDDLIDFADYLEFLNLYEAGC